MWRSIIIHTTKPFAHPRIDLAKPLPNFINTYHSFSNKHVNTNNALLTHKLSLFGKAGTTFRYLGDNSIPVGSAKPELPKFDKNNPVKEPKKEDTRMLNLLGIFVSGVLTYYGISKYLEYRSKKPKNYAIDYTSQNLPGLIKPSKKIVREKNPGNVKLTLYQFTTCPFCCKVRAYLDYFGYSYDIVEVNSLTKKQLNWSPGYKGVPVLAVQIPSKENPNEYEKEIVQINDSSVIVSALETFRLDPSYSLREIVRYFEPIEFDSEGNRQSKPEYSNRYFVMLYNESVKEGKSISQRKQERDWRSWVDAKFVHVISPNCYRTFGEAVATFRWFEKAGEWEKEFNSFERAMMVYVGSFVMWLIAIKLKKKYELKDNVRESFDDCSEEWTSTIDSNDTFKGGKKPNLADLALYGSMNSFEGCAAFEDMMKHNKIRAWFLAMKELVTNSQGAFYLNNPTIKN